VCEYKEVTKKVKVPVTTYHTVTQVIEETVPVTTCIAVPVAPAVCVH
jgi:hypothetical protein